MSLLDQQLDTLADAATIELSGTVLEARGLAVRVVDLPAPVGASVTIDSRIGSQHHRLEGEVVGFDRNETVVMPLGPMAGVRRGDRVTAGQFRQFVRVGFKLLGRVVDAMGRPIDGKGPIDDTVSWSLTPSPVDPMDRPPIDQPLATGVRAIDAMLSVGQGQRLGIFASPGLGKSTLLSMMARHTSADVTVIGLVGERGREVRDFIDEQLGEEGMKRSVVVCATSDEPALLRIRAAVVATAVAEYFRDQGLNVLLLMDSVTRLCQAQRQVGLAAGEPPATRGFPPSVFSLLPTVLERCGRTSKGSITGFFAVLVEGDEVTDPISDAARGILDGHVQLSHALANRNHWPAINVLTSISRVADSVTTPDHQAARREVIKMLSAYRDVEDLLNIGAYPAGSNPDFDMAIACKPAIDQLLQQARSEAKGKANFDHAKRLLIALTNSIAEAKKSMAKQTQARPAGPRG
ncbi:MAG: FliI/YscN family ATPase [Phycisphaeraceae bacterium]